VLSASQLGITLASLGLGWVAEATLGAAVEHWFAALPFAMEVSLRVTIGATVAYTVVTYLHVVFGELAPRAAALNHPEHFARWLAPPLLVFATIVGPFIYVLNRSSHLVLRAFRQNPDLAEESVHSPEELRMLVEQSQESGALEQNEGNLIGAAFEFSEKNARAVMTPRTNLVALPLDASLDDTLAAVADTGFSRYPVYDGTIDDVVGIVLAKDLIGVLQRRAAGDPAAAEFSLGSILREVHVVPGSREVEEVLADFKRLKEHLAVVLDEYGGTAGVVTMDDLLEEIVGAIPDEYDDMPVAAPARELGGEHVVSGATNIGELNDELGLTVPEADYTTIGGFVFGALGRLPTPGDRVAAGGATFVVRAMAGRRVDTLGVELNAAAD
jgi:CBS domain containing-hemolysin-like protein